MKIILTNMIKAINRYSTVSYIGQFYHSRNFATKAGDSYIHPYNPNINLPPHWKRPWFFAMKRKAEIEGPEKPIPRYTLHNWNYEAEIAAFKLRLGIECPEQLLKTVLCGYSTSDEIENDNKELCNHGKHFLNAFLSHYLNIVFPELPLDAKQAIQIYLFDTSQLSHLAINLGIQDFLQTLAYPPSKEELSNCFLALLEAINFSQGPVSAGRFVLDFVLPFLIGKDILDDLWKPKDPMSLLCAEMKRLSKPLPESRLSRQSGINTVLPLFFVSLYSGEEFLAESGGESIPLAEADAAKQALKQLYNIHPNSSPLPMGVSVDNEFLSRLFEPLVSLHKKSEKLISNSKFTALSS